MSLLFYLQLCWRKKGSKPRLFYLIILSPQNKTARILCKHNNEDVFTCTCCCANAEHRLWLCDIGVHMSVDSTQQTMLWIIAPGSHVEHIGYMWLWLKSYSGVVCSSEGWCFAPIPSRLNTEVSFGSPRQLLHQCVTCYSLHGWMWQAFYCCVLSIVHWVINQIRELYGSFTLSDMFSSSCLRYSGARRTKLKNLESQSVSKVMMFAPSLTSQQDLVPPWYFPKSWK